MINFIKICLKSGILILTSLLFVSCASTSHEDMNNEGGIVGSGHDINCELQPDHSKCRKTQQ